MQHAADEFAGLVDPLGLKGPNRDLCREAFEANPGGFRRVVDDAVERGRNPASFLVHLVRSGDHLVQPAEEQTTIERNRCGCTHPECRFQDRCIAEMRG